MTSLFAVGVLVSTPRPTAAATTTIAIPVDRQAYVSDTPVDPYNNDSTAIHVGVAAGTETSRSSAHLDLTPLTGQTPTSVVVTFHPPGSTSPGTVAVSAVSIKVCVLTQPPAYDCSGANTVAGTVSSDGSWSFDVAPLVERWQTSANNGFALLPATTMQSDTWQQAFAVSATKAVATVAESAVQPTPAATATAPLIPPASTLSPVAPIGPVATATPSSAPSPTPAAPVASAHPPMAAGGIARASGGGGGAARWLIALLCCTGTFALFLGVLAARRTWGAREVDRPTVVRDLGPRTRLGILRENSAVTAGLVGLLLTGFVVSGLVGARATAPSSPATAGLGQGQGNGRTPSSENPSASAATPGAGSGSPSTPTGSQPGAGAGPGGGSAGGATPTSGSCRWTCDIPYSGDGSGRSGPAPRPPGGNGGATEVGVDATTIHIAEISPSSSSNTGGSGDVGAGYDSYINRINQNEGGVYGRKIVLDFYSTNNDTPSGGVAAAKQTAANDLAATIVSGVDGAEAAAATMDQLGVPDLDDQSTEHSLNAYPTVFTYTSPVEDHARGLVDFVSQRMGHAHDKACVFMTNQSIWLSYAKPAMLDEANRIGLDIPVFAETQYTQTSFTPEVTQMEQAGCHTIIMFTVLEEVGIVRDARSSGYTGDFTADEWTADLFVQGQYGAANLFAGMKVLRVFGTSDQPGFQDYMRDHQRYASGETAIPDASIHYAEAVAIVEALKRAGPHLTRRTFMEALLTFRNFSTGGILDNLTYVAQDRAGSHSVFSAQCCDTGSDGTTRFYMLDGWRPYAGFR